MRILKPLMLSVALFVLSAAAGSAQDVVRPQFNSDRQGPVRNNERDYADLVEGVFAPVTEKLNLTNEQKFRIVSIIAGTIFKADPLLGQLDELDDQINEVTFAYPVDESRIRQLSAQQAEVMGQIIAMKARAKASMYQLLTPQQRAIVADQFRGKATPAGRLGSISN
jgi:Spy/CpxP family protein refolding chaperone